MIKKLFGQCATSDLEKPQERYRSTTDYALEKTLTGTAYEILCPEIKLDDNSKLVEELKIKIQELKTQLETVIKPISAGNSADEFIKLIENWDPNLYRFFRIIFQFMNPNTKILKTKEALKQKVMLLCYQIEAL
ncbi:11120_t:CDS:2 [Diversispora eburnea]|uniref:11120_t:CDS:1 n=1 Tax=Diversispora eburnea TaxID=1213867 RepID=A0A9N9C9Z1_9GLOM|nr:11120_t:CDS:2 [Diversispora eburnea]